MRSSTLWGSSSGTFSRSVRTMSAVKSSGRMSTSEPLNARPMGVRAVATMTASGMGSSSCYSGSYSGSNSGATLASLVTRRRDSGLVHVEGSGVRETLTHPLTRAQSELVGVKEHPVGVARVVSRAVLEDRFENFRIVGLVFVHEDFQYRRRGHELGLHDAQGRLVRALLVNRFRSRHAERHHNGRSVSFDHVLRRDGQVLETGHGLTDDLKGGAVAGSRGEFRSRGRSHVVASEHGVDDTDFHLGLRLVFGLVVLLRHPTPISLQCRE